MKLDLRATHRPDEVGKVAAELDPIFEKIVAQVLAGR